MDSFCVTVSALFTRVSVWKPQLTLSSLFLRSNLHGKQPADYAVSQEMQEIFRRGSDGTATPLSPSANLSVVCMHTGVLIVLCLFMFERLMPFLRWVGLWRGKNWCSWPPDCCTHSSSNWSDWGSCWEGEWLTAFLPQVGLSVSVIFQMCPPVETPDTTAYDFPSDTEIQSNHCCQSAQSHCHWSARSMSNAPVGNQSSFGCPAQQKDVLSW